MDLLNNQFGSMQVTPEPIPIGSDDPVFRKAAKQFDVTSPNYQFTKVDPKPLVSIKNPEPFGLYESNYYRYARRSNFDELGFSPYADNETLYNNNSTVLGEIGRGLMGMAINTGVTAMDSFESTYDMVTGNWGNLFESDRSSAIKFSDINRVYGSTEGGVTGFIANNAINFGFVTGMMASMIPDLALSYATGGLASGSLLSKLPLLGSVLSKTDDAVNVIKTAKVLDIADQTKTAQFLNRLSQTSPEWIKTGVGGLGKVVLPNVAEYIDDAFNAAKIGENLPSVGKGVGAMYKELQTLKFAAVEAQLEGGFVEDELYNETVNKFYETYGYYPDDETLEKIRTAAKKGGDKVLMANLPVIYLTDAILLKPILAMGKTASRVTGLSNGLGTNLAKSGIRQTADGAFEAVKKSFKSNFSPTNLKRFGKNLISTGLGEGLQENFQEVVSAAYKNYYSDLLSDPLNIPFEDMKGTFDGPLEIFNMISNPELRKYSGKAIEDQFTSQGLETFLSGFFIGGLTGVGGSKIATLSKMATAKGREEIKLLKAQEKEATDEMVRILNESNADVYKLFNPRLRNYQDANNLLKEYQQAKLQNDKKKQKDILEELRFNHLMTVMQTGQLNNFKSKLTALQSLDDTGVVEAVGIEDPKEARQRLTETISYAEGLEKKFKAVNEQYENPFKTDQFAPGSPEYNRVRINHYAFEQAKRDLIFLSDSGDKTKERIESLRSNISANNVTGKISALDIDVLTSEEALREELSLLDKEVFAEPETPEQKKVLKDKLSRKKSLTTYLKAFSEYRKATKPATKQKYEKALEKAHKNFVIQSAQSGKATLVDESKIEADFTSIIDSIELAKDNEATISAINYLNNPIKLTNYAVRNAAIIEDVILNRNEYFKKSLDLFKRNIKSSQLIKEIYDLGFIVGVDEVPDLINQKMPKVVYNIKTKKAVDINSDEAAPVKDLLEEYGFTFDEAAPADTTTDRTEPAEPGTEPTPQAQAPRTVEDEFKDVDEEPAPTVTQESYDFDTLPVALKNVITDAFNRVNETRRAEGEDLIGSIRQFMLLGSTKKLIKDWLDANKDVPTQTSQQFDNFKKRISAAQTQEELFDIDTDIAVSDLSDTEIDELSNMIEDKRKTFGVSATTPVEPTTDEEKSAVNQSMEPAEDFLRKRRAVIENSVSQTPEELDDDFFDNINEC
jgi:hypothetical protein